MIYLFATEGPNFSGFDESGLRGWRTAEGISWEPLGQVIPESRSITHVTSTGQGFIALESREDGGEFAVWQSDDGTDWSVAEVAPQDLDPWTGVTPTVAGGSHALLVVTGRTRVNIYERIQEEWSSLGGERFNVPDIHWGYDLAGDEITFPVYGPLGFPLTVFTPEDLDLSPEEIQVVIDDYRGGNPTTIVWSRTESAGWQQAEIADAFSIVAISPTPDGGVVAFGYGLRGFARWSSSDGVNWEENEARSGPSRIDQWQGRLVGPSDTGRASVVVSDDDGSWENIGPGEHFPNDLDWGIVASGAGPGGVAATLIGLERGGRPAEVELEDRPKLTSDDATLTLDPVAGSYSLETRDGTTEEWSMNSSSAPDAVAVDLDNGAIDFHDPDTGDLLASFLIEDIVEAQNSYRSSGSISAAHHAFAFTSDGTDWTIQDLFATCPHPGWCRIFGNNPFISHLEVTRSRVVAVAISDTGPNDPDRSLGFVVWSAPIP